MRLKKVTVMDSCGNVNAAVVDGSMYTELGNYWCPPCGQGGTVIKVELVLEVPDELTAGHPKEIKQ